LDRHDLRSRLRKVHHFAEAVRVKDSGKSRHGRLRS